MCNFINNTERSSEVGFKIVFLSTEQELWLLGVSRREVDC